MSEAELMGTWGEMIDVVRETTQRKQEKAGSNFQQCVALANQQGPKPTSQGKSKFL